MRIIVASYCMSNPRKPDIQLFVLDDDFFFFSGVTNFATYIYFKKKKGDYYSKNQIFVSLLSTL